MNEKIISIISKVTKKTEEELMSSSNDSNLWDSLKHVEIIMALEEEFDIVFEPEDIANCRTVEKILETVSSKV